MVTLIEIIEVVEDNNNINNAQWSDWQMVPDILDHALNGRDMDEEGLGQEYIISVLERAIETNGKSLSLDLIEYEKKVYGLNFANSDCAFIANKYL